MGLKWLAPRFFKRCHKFGFVIFCIYFIQWQHKNRINNFEHLMTGLRKINKTCLHSRLEPCLSVCNLWSMGWLFSKVFLLSWVAVLYRNVLTGCISHKLTCSWAPLPSAKPTSLPKLPPPSQWSVQSVTLLWHIWILSSYSLLQSVARSSEVLLNILWFYGLSNLNFCWSSVSGIAI